MVIAHRQCELNAQALGGLGRHAASPESMRLRQQIGTKLVCVARAVIAQIAHPFVERALPSFPSRVDCLAVSGEQGVPGVA
eukprot:scaffold36314_cov139-Isochrysis_galbana.AAC.5